MTSPNTEIPKELDSSFTRSMYIQSLLDDDSPTNPGSISDCDISSRSIDFSALSIDDSKLSIDESDGDQSNVPPVCKQNQPKSLAQFILQENIENSFDVSLPRGTNLESSRVAESEPVFNLPSNLSKIESNTSLAYSISFEAPSYSPNHKRLMTSAPKLSKESPKNTDYSPLFRNILNLSKNSPKESRNRRSEFFRNELSLLAISTNQKSIIDSPSDKEISFGSPCDLSNKENFNLSIDEISPSNAVSSFTAKKNGRFSQFFRAELTQLNISSPDISFDINDILSKEALSKTGDLSIDSDENSDAINCTNKTRSRLNIMDSSDEEDSDGDYESDGDDMGDFIVYSAEEDDEEESSNEDKEESSNEDKEESSNEDKEESFEEDEEISFGENEIGDVYITPTASTKTDTLYYTPKSTKIKKVSGNVPNMFKTPTSTCYPSQDSDIKSSTQYHDRRRTCIATPLYVKSKTGTPALPNRTFARNMSSVARELFEQFNESIFKNQLPGDMEIKFNKRLNTTAGRCVYLRKGAEYQVYIELSPKVVDCLERLKETLAHELCHAAAFIIDHKMDNHGPIWRRWAMRVNTKYPELPPVTRCHTYEIKYKYNYTCSESWCNYKIGRYSRSINLSTARCPLCFSRLVLPDSQKSTKPPNMWTEFVKDNYNRVKQDNVPTTPHRDLMKELSRRFKVQQTA